MTDNAATGSQMTEDATPLPDFAPPPFPRAGRMLFCVGAQKAGTTWLYDFLCGHPDCHFAPNKELHYFDVMAGRGKMILEMRVRLARDMAARLEPRAGPHNSFALRHLESLSRLLGIYTGGGPPEATNRHAPYLTYLLQDYRDQPAVCDITPGYAILDRVHFADMASIGDARFLFILRDPVDRMWSQLRMAIDTMNLSEDDYAPACLDRARQLIETGQLAQVARARYDRTMQELDAAVAPDRVRYVFYEDLFRQSTVDSICAFAGIAPREAAAAARVNPGRELPIPPEIEARFAAILAPQYQAVRARFGAAVPASWHTP
jgi:hypothetical protein